MAPRAPIVAVLALALGCGGGDGVEAGEPTCDGAAGTYQVELGPGTGDCDPSELSPLEEIDPLTIGEAPACGRRTLIAVAQDGECATQARLIGTVSDDGIDDAVIELERTCADGSACDHAFQAIVTRRGAR